MAVNQIKTLFLDDGVTVSPPANVVLDVAINGFSSHASDSDFVAAKGSAATQGDSYFNTSTNEIRCYDTFWKVYMSNQERHNSLKRWGHVSNGSTSVMYGVCYSDELGIFVSVGTNYCVVSNCGVGWTSKTIPSASWQSVCWSPELNLFCAVATNAVCTSPDGTTWTSRTPAGAENWAGVCWSPELNLFCAVATSGTTRVMTSPNGINWTHRTPSDINSWSSVCWSPDLGLFCASSYTTATNRIMTSPDGINWTGVALGENLFDICWSPELGLFLAVATNKCYTSPDGTNWTARPTATGGWYGGCWSSYVGAFCMVSMTGTMTYSFNGIDWSKAVSSSSLQCRRVAYGKNKFVAATSGGATTDRMYVSC